jgi:phosphatidylserine decarboxylase
MDKSVRLVDTLCRPRVNITPFSQIIGIELMKIKATKGLTKKVVKYISQKHCAAWKVQTSSVARKSIKQFIRNFAVDWRKASRCQGLSLDDCVQQYKSLNSFFGRNITPAPRTTVIGDKTIVSPAQCRMVAYSDVKIATRVWVKGFMFSIRKLLGDKISRDDVSRYNNCSIAIFRLAPSDYHRFHSPVEGKIIQHHVIDGTYYSVNPTIVNSAIDVFGENKREVLYIETLHFGIIAYIIVGATCAGGIKLGSTIKPNKVIKLSEYMGKFAFGGSTIIMVIPKNKIRFCSIFSKNSHNKIETLINVGDTIGHKI